jgi:hypothetical protein
MDITAVGTHRQSVQPGRRKSVSAQQHPRFVASSVQHGCGQSIHQRCIEQPVCNAPTTSCATSLAICIKDKPAN